MKKSLIALAVLAASGVVSAQSNVTLYGLVDVYLGSTKVKAHLEAYKSRGFARAMMNDLSGAIADFDRAVEISPRHADAYNARGNVHAMAGHLVASLRDFNLAIRIDRNFADAYYNRALSRHGLGDSYGAKSDLSRAAQLFRQQRDIGGYQQAREWMDKLR